MKTFSMNKMQRWERWEIWLANVWLKDRYEIPKERPVLVVSSEMDSTGYIVCFLITSKRKWSEKDYSIQNWKELGLTKESTILIHQGVFGIRPEDFIEKVSELLPHNISEMEDLLRFSPYIVT